MTDAKIRSKLRAKNTFLTKAKNKYGYKFNYDYLPTYLPEDDKISLRCKIHGKFETTAKQHIASKYGGCHKCRVEAFRKARGITTKAFIKKLKEIHGDYYDYSKIKYINAHHPVTLICPEHGEFLKEPRILTTGAGCPKCAKIHKNSSAHYGWTHSSWKEAGSKSKTFDGYKIYILFCTDSETEEKFIKIGKTFNTIANRFPKSVMPYEYVVLLQQEGSAKMISQLEVALHNYYKKYRHIPLKSFAGETECFAPDINLTKGIPAALSKVVGKELIYIPALYG